MSSSAAAPDLGTSTIEVDSVRSVARLRWLWLIVGVAWFATALVVLQFDEASITTVGIIVGLMLLFAGGQQLLLATVADSLKWLPALFAGLAGIWALVQGSTDLVRAFPIRRRRDAL